MLSNCGSVGIANADILLDPRIWWKVLDEK
jgi:hypothetical protein